MDGVNRKCDAAVDEVVVAPGDVGRLGSGGFQRGSSEISRG